MPEISCSDVHSRRCTVVVSAVTNDHAVAQMTDHLAWAHGMTPAWFTPARRDHLYSLLRGSSRAN